MKTLKEHLLDKLNQKEFTEIDRIDLDRMKMNINEVDYHLNELRRNALHFFDDDELFFWFIKELKIKELLIDVAKIKKEIELLNDYNFE